MNRAARRQQERNKKKAVKKGDFQMEMEAIQPWSDVLMRLTLPPNVIKGLLEITDQILQDPDRKNWGSNLAGQIQDEPLIPHEMMMDYTFKDPGGNDSTIFGFLMNILSYEPDHYFYYPHKDQVF
mgnify:CR=1 FL=1